MKTMAEGFVSKGELKQAYHDLLQKYYRELDLTLYDPADRRELEIEVNELSQQFLFTEFVPEDE